MATVEVQFGGKGGAVYELETNHDLVAVRTRSGGAVGDANLSAVSRRLLDRLEPVTQFPDAGVEVFHVRSGMQTERDMVRATLSAEKTIRFAGRVLESLVHLPTTAGRDCGAQDSRCARNFAGAISRAIRPRAEIVQTVRRHF